jgi:chitin-binding protein
VKLIRRLGVLSATALLGTALVVAISPAPAQAHGVTMFPGSRTFLCWQDGLRPNGEIVPFNPACGAAVQQTGTTPLYNWFAVLLSNAGGRTSEIISDGNLCGPPGGPFDFTAYNAVRTDWGVTHLTSGASYQIRHSNWARHPSAAPAGFRVSITRQGWTRNQQLRWSDLQQIQFVSDPPENIPQAGSNNYYFWNLQMPSGRSGDAILYIQWIRSDSAENFFSCSDIVFDGGNGQVTGIGPNQTIPPNTSTPPNNTTSPPNNTTSPPNNTTTPPNNTTTPPQTGACSATFSVVGTPWSSGFQGQFTVRAGNAPVNGWTVRWTNPSGQAVNQVWEGRHTANGQSSTVVNETYNGSIAANGTRSFGLLASGTARSVSNVTCTSP